MVISFYFLTFLQHLQSLFYVHNSSNPKLGHGVEVKPCHPILIGLSIPGDGDVSFLERDLGGALRCAHSGINALAELGRPDEEEVLLLVAGDEDVVLVLALLPRPVLERGHAVAVLAVVEPLPFVLETVAALADAEPAALVVLPLAHVGLCHVSIKHLILKKKKLYNVQA